MSIEEEIKLIVERKREMENSKTKRIPYYLSSEILTLIARVIKKQYTERKIKNIFLNKMINIVSKKIQRYYLSKEEISCCITELIKRVDGWLTFVDNKDGIILKCDRKIKFKTIFNSIDEKN